MTSDMPRTEAAFSKVIAWAEAHPDASWEESAQNVLTTLSQELADMERELANCKRDLAIMVGRADNEERATERAERAEAKLAALQAPQDVAGLVGEMQDCAEMGQLFRDVADALLSLSAQLAEQTRLAKGWESDAQTMKANWHAACHDIAERDAQLREKEAECEGLREALKHQRTALSLVRDRQCHDGTCTVSLADIEKGIGQLDAAIATRKP